MGGNTQSWDAYAFQVTWALLNREQCSLVHSNESNNSQVSCLNAQRCEEYTFGGVNYISPTNTVNSDWMCPRKQVKYESAIVSGEGTIATNAHDMPRSFLTAVLLHTVFMLRMKVCHMKGISPCVGNVTQTIPSVGEIFDNHEY